MLAGLIGTPTSHSVVVVERGPVSFFADAVVDDNPVYKDPAAAKDEGFENIPVPPTYPFVMDHWGAFTEFQSGETFAGIGPALGALMSKGASSSTASRSSPTTDRWWWATSWSARARSSTPTRGRARAGQ